MATEARRTVVILYEHALLGEGIATYLRAQIDVEATLEPANDPGAVESALSLGPDVVIFESKDPFQDFDLKTLAPHAVLIDLSTVIARGSVLTPCVAGLAQILQTVRDSGGSVDGGGNIDSGGIARPSATCHAGSTAPRA